MYVANEFHFINHFLPSRNLGTYLHTIPSVLASDLPSLDAEYPRFIWTRYRFTHNGPRQINVWCSDSASPIR